MLSRTADHLYWMARYMERAENTARMLDVNYQAGLLPQPIHGAEQGWTGLLAICELGESYARRYGDVRPQSVIEFMLADERNPSSIRNCVLAARENARAVRGTLTTEVWETANQTWIEFGRMLERKDFLADPSSVFEWVKFRSHLSRGVRIGTMLHDEAIHFLRIGSSIERADNTARILDVKFQGTSDRFITPEPRGVVVSRAAGVSQSLLADSAAAGEVEYDFYHWSAILRSMSGFEIYRQVYRNVIRPEKVAELLILRADMPRSLAGCVNELLTNLRLVANQHSAETLRCAGRLAADLSFARIDEILEGGLHGFLTRFLERVGTLGVGISRDFLVPVSR